MTPASMPPTPRPFPFRKTLGKLRRGIVGTLFSFRNGRHHPITILDPTLAAALGVTEGSSIPPSDISDHLNLLFHRVVERRPRLIVELGTRGGASTRALLAGAEVVDALVLSVDLDDCGTLPLPHGERWRFIRGDDVAFGESGFREWAEGEGVEPRVDLLFLDTSHEYEHTKRELEVWLPHLAPEGVIMLHDTNMGEGIFTRLDGSVGHGWDNRRGVVRALEEALGAHLPENGHFVTRAGGYLIRHTPTCGGLTELTRLPKP